MSEVLQANVFFYITSVAVVLVTIFIIVILAYVISILRNVKRISDTLQEGSEVIKGDLGELRKNLREEGSKVRTIIDFFIDRLVPKKARRSRKRASSHSKSTEEEL